MKYYRIKLLSEMTVRERKSLSATVPNFQNDIMRLQGQQIEVTSDWVMCHPEFKNEGSKWRTSELTVDSFATTERLNHFDDKLFEV